jgi:hypothetical protein
MHYDFKAKINKVDSQQYKNMLIPEIDWALNEAQELFVKMVAEPRLRSQLGFELTQRNIDDIRTLVKKDTLTVTNNTSSLPNDYWHFLRARVTMEKDPCGTADATLHVRQHDDEFEESEFDKSSFEWRIVNGVFNVDGIEFFTDGTFTITSVLLNYLGKPAYIHNAANFRNGTYNLPNGTVLAGTVDCELPFQTHREIVDIAVLIVTGELQVPDYQIKMAKLNLNNLK